MGRRCEVLCLGRGDMQGDDVPVADVVVGFGRRVFDLERVEGAFQLLPGLGADLVGVGDDDALA